MINFDTACTQQSELLRDLLIESKSYWGYTTEQLEYWRGIVKFEASYIENNTVKVISLNSKIIGFFAIKRGENDELDHLWLLPEAIGKGIGNIAFDEILVHCKQQGISSFLITSDPDAEGFYINRGAIRVAQVMSEAQNRMLPQLKYTLV